MISLTESRNAPCDVRLTLKTQDQTLMRQAMAGAGLTRWEAQVLPKVVEGIYFQDGLTGPGRMDRSVINTSASLPALAAS